MGLSVSLLGDDLYRHARTAALLYLNRLVAVRGRLRLLPASKMATNILETQVRVIDVYFLSISSDFSFNRKFCSHPNFVMWGSATNKACLLVCLSVCWWSVCWSERSSVDQFRRKQLVMMRLSRHPYFSHFCISA